jgi:hypothetical protein
MAFDSAMQQRSRFCLQKAVAPQPQQGGEVLSVVDCSNKRERERRLSASAISLTVRDAESEEQRLAFHLPFLFFQIKSPL